MTLCRSKATVLGMWAAADRWIGHPVHYSQLNGSWFLLAPDADKKLRHRRRRKLNQDLMSHGMDNQQTQSTRNSTGGGRGPPSLKELSVYLQRRSSTSRPIMYVWPAPWFHEDCLFLFHNFGKIKLRVYAIWFPVTVCTKVVKWVVKSMLNESPASAHTQWSASREWRNRASYSSFVKPSESTAAMESCPLNCVWLCRTVVQGRNSAVSRALEFSSPFTCMPFVDQGDDQSALLR